jgi:hypothetical protein
VSGLHYHPPSLLGDWSAAVAFANDEALLAPVQSATGLARQAAQRSVAGINDWTSDEAQDALNGALAHIEAAATLLEAAP